MRELKGCILYALLFLWPIKSFATDVSCSEIEKVICKGGYVFYLYSCTSDSLFTAQPSYRPVVNKDGSLAVCKKDKE